MEINLEILKKAEDKIKSTDVKNYIDVCLRAELCPKCGNPLSKKDMLNHSWIKYNCSQCDFQAER